jgi:replication factor C subunit 3/5
MSKIPWVEFYRPTKFEDIVLDPLNKQILNNILSSLYFPNLLLYGPPGTGKTTTIINLINTYHASMGLVNKDLIIHLNASDERGVDIIRNQICSFVNAKSFFRNGMKFVILDEVDYMTKNAQQALKYLLQEHTHNVRFCLICNYISKIDEGLQNYFIKIRFNQLPPIEIKQFLKKIVDSEKLNISDEVIGSIQNMYHSDIRSMINYIQSNQLSINAADQTINIITNEVWEKLFNIFKRNTALACIEKHVVTISTSYNMDKKNIVKEFLNYIIRNKKVPLTMDFCSFVENILHSQYGNSNIYMSYFYAHLLSFCVGCS